MGNAKTQGRNGMGFVGCDFGAWFRFGVSGKRKGAKTQGRNGMGFVGCDFGAWFRFGVSGKRKGAGAQGRNGMGFVGCDFGAWFRFGVSGKRKGAKTQWERWGFRVRASLYKGAVRGESHFLDSRFRGNDGGNAGMTGERANGGGMQAFAFALLI